MNERCRSLVSPLNCAAYLTWCVVLVELVIGGFDESRTTQIIGLPAIVALMLAFLAGFLFDAWRSPGAHESAASPISLGVETIVALALVALTHDGSTPVLLIIVVAQAVALPRAQLIALVALANLALLAILLGTFRPQNAWVVFLMYAGFQSFAGLTGYYARQNARSRDELAQVNAHLLATRSLLEESARDGERLRLARELHDVAGHKLTALKLQLALLARDPAAPPAPAVGIASTLAAELLDDLRAVVGQLRRHEGLDLKRAIEELAAPLPRPKVHIEIGDDTRIDDVAQAQALLRAAQEALTNAARHSGADNVWLTLARTQGRVVLSVRDDGRGVDVVRSGNGLSGMRERLEALGGGLDIGNGHGFHIDAWVPVA